MTDETEVMWSPGDVAKRLRVSPSGLRRLAGVYAQVYGEIPTDSSSTSRRWPTEAVNRLEQARALMAVGQARSIRDALLAAQSGAVLSAEAAVALGGDGRVVEALRVVAVQLRAVQNSSKELRLEVEALRRELRTRYQGERYTLPAPLAYGGVPAEGEQAVTANDGTKDQESGRSEADGLVVRVARWPELLLRSNS